MRGGEARRRCSLGRRVKASVGESITQLWLRLVYVVVVEETLKIRT